MHVSHASVDFRCVDADPKPHDAALDAPPPPPPPPPLLAASLLLHAPTTSAATIPIQAHGVARRSFIAYLPNGRHGARATSRTKSDVRARARAGCYVDATCDVERGDDDRRVP